MAKRNIIIGNPFRRKVNMQIAIKVNTDGSTSLHVDQYRQTITMKPGAYPVFQNEKVREGFIRDMLITNMCQDFKQQLEKAVAKWEKAHG